MCTLAYTFSSPLDSPLEPPRCQLLLDWIYFVIGPWLCHFCPWGRWRDPNWTNSNNATSFKGVKRETEFEWTAPKFRWNLSCLAPYSWPSISKGFIRRFNQLRIEFHPWMWRVLVNFQKFDGEKGKKQVLWVLKTGTESWRSPILLNLTKHGNNMFPVWLQLS